MSKLNRKGFKRSIRRKRYNIQPKDLVKISNKWFETKGSHCKGSRVMISGKSMNINLVERVFHYGSLVWRSVEVGYSFVNNIA